MSSQEMMFLLYLLPPFAVTTEATRNLNVKGKERKDKRWQCGEPIHHLELRQH